jgi:hypothetical protein
MGQTLRYFEWKKSWWLSLQFERGQSDNPPLKDIQRGLHVYAHRQAEVYNKLIISFASQWRSLLTSHKPTPDWLTRYPNIDKHSPPQASSSSFQRKARTPVDPANHKPSDVDFEPPRPSSSMDFEPSSPSSSLEPRYEVLDAPLTGDKETGDNGDDGDEDYIVDEMEGFDLDD